MQERRTCLSVLNWNTHGTQNTIILSFYAAAVDTTKKEELSNLTEEQVNLVVIWLVPFDFLLTLITMIKYHADMKD